MDKYILTLALETLKEQVLDAMKDKQTEQGIKISEQHLARINKQLKSIAKLK
jgi:hypothetical protein